MQKFTLFFLLVLSSVFAGAQCLTAVNGIYPAATFTPACTGGSETITTLGYGSEYSKVNLTGGITYTFTSSVATDFITISDSAGTTAFTSGVTPVNYTPAANVIVRFYTHTSSACGAASVDRTRAVSCPLQPCSGTPAGGTATASPATFCTSPAAIALNATGVSVGSGISVQWQSAPAGSGSWADIGGATTVAYSASATVATDYRLRVTCSNGGQRRWPPVQQYCQNCYQSTQWQQRFSHQLQLQR